MRERPGQIAKQKVKFSPADADIPTLQPFRPGTERGPSRPAARSTIQSGRFFQGRDPLLPLPEGEVWGEGEVHVQSCCRLSPPVKPRQASSSFVKPKTYPPPPQIERRD